MAITLLRPAGKREKRNALPRSSASGSELGTETARREGMAEKRAKQTAEGGGSALPVSRADAPELLPNASKREQAAQRLRSAAAQAAEEDRRARLAVYLQRLAESGEPSKRSAVNALHTARDRDPDLIGAARSNTALRLTDAGTGRDSVPSRWAPPTREGLPFTPSGVVSTGGQAAYDAVAKSDGTVDYTDWEKLTTGQQRERLKRSGLTEGEQWTILNKDESYIRTLGTIADIQRYRSAYGLSAREATELCNALVEIELKKSNAGKEGNPRRSPDYLRYLEEQREKLLHTIWNNLGRVGNRGDECYNKKIKSPLINAFVTIPHFTMEEKVNWKKKHFAETDDSWRWDGYFISNQNKLSGKAGSFGALGSLKENGCGIVAIHNTNVILGDRLPGKRLKFDELAFRANQAGRFTTLFGGIMGMNPGAVSNYYREKGCDVHFYLNSGMAPTNHDAYLILYLYRYTDLEGRSSLQGHYVAAEYDSEKKQYTLYNDNVDYIDSIETLQIEKAENARNNGCDVLLSAAWGIDAPKG